MRKIRTLMAVPMTCLCMSAWAQVNIDVDIAQRGIEISPTLYGIFYEDINFASDGGLYAELIRNRSFEYNAEQPEHWDAKGANISLTTEGLLNEKQGHALKVETLAPNGGISNEGYWGINVVAGTRYKLSFWINLEKGNPGNIKAILAEKSGKQLGETLISQKLKKGWQKIESTIVAEASDPQAVFHLQFEKPSTALLDVVSLFPPTYKGRENGCRIDLAEKLEALHPAFMRFPGGCYVEGNHKPENAYHWERTVGPIERRPGHMNANWGYPTTDGLGFHEFLQLSEDLGAKPLYVVNIGIWHGGCTPLNELQPWIDECLGALEYANGPVTSHYGKMRAENGHPEPFNIAYIEIGNENYNYHMENNSDQSDHYPERYRMFYDAIKARFPEVQCIGNVESWGTDYPKWRNNHPVDILDEHYYRTPQWFVSQYNRFDNYDRRGPIIYPGEYAVTNGYGTTGNMNAAMGEAVFMIGMENNADIVRMSSYAPIFVNENSIQWRPDMIRFNSSQSFGTPSYWVQQLFPNHVGNRVVKNNLQWSIPQKEEKTNAVPVGVGVATWKTQASYRNPQLIIYLPSAPEGFIDDGGPRDVALSDMKDWRSGNSKPSYQGHWVIEADGTLRQTSDAEESMRVCPETTTAKRYTYKVQARKDGGAEGFMIVFNYIDEKNFDWLNLGGWGNSKTSVETTYNGGRNNLGGDRTDHYDTDRWYDIQLDVDGEDIVAQVDGKVVYKGKKKNGQMHGVYANSTLDEKTNTLYTKIVNLCGEGTTGTLHLSGGVAASAEMVRLAGMTGEDENTMQYPTNIVPRPAKVQAAEGGRTLTFDVAPFSINIITTKLR
ncbi:MAG: carbohydrate binding domain-containing protein [Bacteroidaceae bacterium]|nr:carbohydrate binding domain-containing protein [Bacteroidaceae bacterium]